MIVRLEIHDRGNIYHFQKEIKKNKHSTPLEDVPQDIARVGLDSLVFSAMRALYSEADNVE